MLAGFFITRRISVFWVFPVVGLEMLACLAASRRTFLFPPRVREVFRLGLPSFVCVGKEPFSCFRFLR